MLKLTIEASSIADLKTKLLAAASELGGTAASTTEAPKADAKKPAAAAKPAAAPKAEIPALDFKTQVVPPFLALADKNRDKAMEVLSGFGVAKAGELKPAQYAEFVAAVAAADEALENLV